jgi:hypothetical protein
LVGSNLIGGTSASGAATSIVSNGIVPMVLGTAIEQGALTQSIQGTVATLRTNLYGLWKFAAGQEPYCLDRECKNAVDFARRVSFSAGFNLSQGSERSTTATAASGTAPPTLDLRLASLRQQLDPFSTRFDFYNQRDVRSREFQKRWNEELNNADLKKAAAELSAQLATLFAGDAVKALVKHTNALVSLLRTPQAATAEQMAMLIDQAAADAAAEMRQATPAMEAVIQRARSVRQRYASMVEKAARDSLARFSYSFEYTYQKPRAQPTLSNIRFIATGSPVATETLMLSANFGLTFYNQKMADIGKLRDVQASAQIDRKLGWQQMEGTLSAAFYYQWMVERAVIRLGNDAFAPGTNIALPGPAATLLAAPGDVYLGQVKLTLSFKGTGLKIPIAFSYANRTELIKATERRGHIGITYDFDHLFVRR